MQYHQIMTAEVKLDCYAGETCDQKRKFFNIFCDGDMQDDDTSEKQIIIKLADLPAGAKISVEYPVCPKCGMPREDKFKFGKGGTMRTIGHNATCECSFNWTEWEDNEYA